MISHTQGRNNSFCPLEERKGRRRWYRFTELIAKLITQWIISGSQQDEAQRWIFSWRLKGQNSYHYHNEPYGKDVLKKKKTCKHMGDFKIIHSFGLE